MMRFRNGCLLLLWVFSVHCVSLWERENTTGDVKALAFSAFAHDKEGEVIYVLGGNTQKQLGDDDKTQFGGRVVMPPGATGTFKFWEKSIYSLDISSKPFTWSKLDAELKSYHTHSAAFFYEDKLYLFGGETLNYAFQDLADAAPHKRDLSVVSVFNGNGSVVTVDTITGDVNATAYTDPSNHTIGQSAIADDKGTFYFYGGIEYGHPPENNGKKLFPPLYFSTLKILDVTVSDPAGNWTILTPTFSPPSSCFTCSKGRAYHSSVIYNNYLYIFGGEIDNAGASFTNFVPTNDFFKCSLGYPYTCTEIEGGPNKPGPRIDHLASVNLGNLTDTADDYMIIQGGRYFASVTNGIWLYYFESGEWQEIPDLYPAPIPRIGGGIAHVENNQFLLMLGNTLFNNYTDEIGILYTQYTPAVQGPGFETNVTGPNGEAISAASFPAEAPSNEMFLVDECGQVDSDRSLKVTFQKMVEVTRWGDAVQTIDLEKRRYNVSVSDVANLRKDFDFGSEVNIDAVFSVDNFEETSSVTFAGTTFGVDPRTSKWTLSLGKWNFVHPEDQLELHLAFGSSSQFKSITHDQNQLGNNLISYELIGEDFKARIGLLTFALLDGNPAPVFPQFTFSEKSPEDTKLIIRFPKFDESLVYDPDFAVLLKDEETSCSSDDNTALFALFVLAVPAVLIILVIIAVVVVYLKWRHAKKQNAKSVQTVDKELSEMPAVSLTDSNSSLENSPSDESNK